jgi:hypothetical protein
MWLGFLLYYGGLNLAMCLSPVQREKCREEVSLLKHNVDEIGRTEPLKFRIPFKTAYYAGQTGVLGMSAIGLKCTYDLISEAVKYL